MRDKSAIELPVLTDVVQVARRAAAPTIDPTLGEQLDAWLIDQLPGLVHEVVVELTPRFEQQLLDALMPRLLASLAQWQGEV
ncbi:hypothetical protein [Inhella sp.]|uniref:hypothetical protein n=1 Tax=Inhella sp. TaxID=1921806 RepID=UPI0035B35449